MSLSTALDAQTVLGQDIAQPWPVLFVSESTGITAEAMGHSLLSQFPGIEFDIQYLPFVDDTGKAEQSVRLMQKLLESTGLTPLVFATMVKRDISEILKRGPCVYVELFDAFLGSIASALGVQPQRKSGLTHGLRKNQAYDARFDTVHFIVENDDGESLDHYREAEVVLLGVSRSGKTPTCLYLAMHFDMRAANYPLTEEDFLRGELPSQIMDVRERLVGLDVNAQRLHKVREQRRPGSRYASLETCLKETRLARTFFRKLEIPFIDATSHSIEELASRIHKIVDE